MRYDVKITLYEQVEADNPRDAADKAWAQAGLNHPMDADFDITPEGWDQFVARDLGERP